MYGSFHLGKNIDYQLQQHLTLALSVKMFKIVSILKSPHPL